MWFTGKPAPRTIAAFLLRQQRLRFSYEAVGASNGDTPQGFVLDHNRIQLGTGGKTFETACDALRRWRHFPAVWTQIYPADAPIEVGQSVAMLARVYGLWWLNACRIVYVVEESNPIRRFGFAYGTLPGHVECGEERFLIECDEQDRVWYDVRAFSRPRHLLVRMFFPLARRAQRRFVVDSQATMKLITAKQLQR